MIPKIVFCPNCRKIIRVPKMLHSGNIIVQTGFITIECGDKKCGGKVKIKTKVMDKQQMIDEILKDYPSYDIMDSKIVSTFGQYIHGVGDTWSWFTRTNKGFPETLKDPEHKFLEQATEDELKELLALLKTDKKQEA